MEGETTNFYPIGAFVPYADVRITQLARGVSVGNEIEYTDEITLGRSLRSTAHSFQIQSAAETSSRVSSIV